MQPVHLPGFEGQQIAVKVGNGFGSSQLFVNGQPATPATQKGQFLLRRNDGMQITAYFKNAFPDTVPILVVDNEMVRLAAPLTWYEWIWAGFPLVLIVLGGAIGGLLGGGAAVINAQIFRSSKPAAVRYILCALVSLIAIAIWVCIVALIRR